jgi:hypothetical protein
MLLIGLCISPLAGASALWADSTGYWEGRWFGAWGGIANTSVTISGNQVVSYVSQNTRVPITFSQVNGDSVTFGSDTFTVTLTKASDTSANAQYRGSQTGDASAVLTRQ